MERIKQIKEAQATAQDLLDNIDTAIKTLSQASNWGIFDIFMGGFATSLVKRSKIKQANDYIQKIEPALASLKSDLGDIGIDFTGQLSDTDWDMAFDVLFDNMFTDIRVQNEIGNTLANLTRLRKLIYNLTLKLTKELNHE